MMNFGLKWLSVKTLINKDNFGIVGEFLMRWKFDLGVMKWLKVAWLVGLSDMEYDKCFGKMDLGFCLILLGFEGFLNMI